MGRFNFSKAVTFLSEGTVKCFGCCAALIFTPQQIRREDQGCGGMEWGLVLVLVFLRGWLKLADLRQSPLDTTQREVVQHVVSVCERYQR